MTPAGGATRYPWTQSWPTGNDWSSVVSGRRDWVLVCQHRSSQDSPETVRYVTSFFRVPAPSSGNPHFLLCKVVSFSLRVLTTRRGDRHSEGLQTGCISRGTDHMHGWGCRPVRVTLALSPSAPAWPK